MERPASEIKTSQAPATVMTEIVLPTDANSLGYLRGGRLVDWMDIASEIACQRHCGNLAVTVSIENVSFSKSIMVGDIVTIAAEVVKTNRTSMEVDVVVRVENVVSGSNAETNQAKLVFVAVDKGGKPTTVPSLSI